MTSSGVFRCSVAADARGDPMLGTAPPQSRVLLVHQPGGWGPQGLVESRCDPAVARRIAAAAAGAGMRLQTIRRPGKHETGVPKGGYHVGIADTRGDANITWWRVDDLAEIVDELEAGWPRREPTGIDTAPLYLVCTHGRHDPCCALRGRPIANALQRLRPGRVWETTHLGGDRFAANVLVLPTGELYGRILEETVPELVRAVDANEILARRLRGRIGMAAVAQAALVYVSERLAIVERDALTAGSIRWLDSTLAEVTIAAPQGDVIVAVEKQLCSPNQLTCHGPENARVRVYRGIDIRAAPA